MLQRKELLLFFLLIVLAFPAFARDNSDITKGNDTIINGITQDETILFNMINDMRRQNNLSSIPLSTDLCKVAQTHIADLIKTRPQDKGCSLHSWSGSGKWTSCCNTKEVFGIQCMKSKPREITGYLGDGYELIYYGEDKATPAEAFELWKQVDASSDMILSRSKWKDYHWKFLGVGIQDGYAILWLGDTIKDTQDKLAGYIPVVEKPALKVAVVPKPAATQKESAKPNPVVKLKETAVSEINNQQPVREAGTKYYIIVASFKTAAVANSELIKIKSLGYPASIILEGESLYRIAISSFDAAEKAALVKNGLKDTFPGIWVYKK